MTALTIDNYPKNVLVIGPLYKKTDKLLRAETMIENYDLTIFNGGLCDIFNDIELIQKHIEIFNRMFETKKVIYNLGSKDLMMQEGLLVTAPPDMLTWLARRPNVTMVTFSNQNKLLVTNGGITPKMTADDLLNDVETSFVCKPWHQTYNGRLGYIISNEPLTLQYPQFYNFSAQIGNLPNEVETQVYAQEVDQFGLKTTILL